MLLDPGCVICARHRGPICGRCQAHFLPATPTVVAGVDVCRVAYTLDDQLKTSIAALKYKRQRRVAAWFAQSLAPLVPIAADCLTWLPATPERRKSRGFDQAQELVRSLAPLTAVPSAPILCRSNNDERQTGQTRAARLAGPSLVAQRACPPFVVVVDDVITTGSSMRVAAAALRRAGAERVVAIAVAATPAVVERFGTPTPQAKREVSLHDLAIGCSVSQWT